jgi:proteasome lid subunit RPN8/RPN11
MLHFDPFDVSPRPQPNPTEPETNSPALPPPGTADGDDGEGPVPFDGCLPATFLEGIDHLLMGQAAYREATAYFASRQPEAACLLLGPRTDEFVSHILIDDEGEATPASFTLAAASLNRKVKPYLAAGLNIKGIWHLHPSGVTSLSAGDVWYARKLFSNPKHRGLERFAMPVTSGGRCYGFMLTLVGGIIGVRTARIVLV